MNNITADGYVWSLASTGMGGNGVGFGMSSGSSGRLQFYVSLNGRVAMLTIWDIAWAVALAVLGGAIWTGWMAYKRNKGKRLTRWPLVGMLPAVLANVRNDFYDWMLPLAEKNGGSFQFYGPKFTNLNYFVTANPRHIEYALRENYQNFPKGEEFRDIYKDLLGDGIFNADGESWRVQRKAASLHIHSAAHKRFIEDTIFTGAQTKLLPLLQTLSAREDKKAMDIQDLLLRFTFDNICNISFGVDTGCLSPELPEVPFARAFEVGLSCTTVRWLLPATWWKLIRWLGIGIEADMAKAVKVIDEFTSNVIDTRRREMREEQSGPPRDDMLSCFMKIDSTNDDRFMKDVCVNFLLAGRDASGLNVGWMLWALSSLPHIQAKVVEELDRIMTPGSTLTRHQINQMVYLHATLNESLRIYGTVPLEMKHIKDDAVLPDGTRVYKNHKFIYGIYAMGRMESIWGPDVLEFKPERWIGHDGQLVTVSPFQFPVFNAGPRSCLGKDMAFVIMKAAAATILYNFKFKVVPGHPVEKRFSMTLYMKHGLLVHLEPRSHGERK